MYMNNNTKNRIDRYLLFIKKYPHLFVDGGPGSLRLVLSREELLIGQEKLYLNAKKKGHPLNWYDIGIVSEDKWIVSIRDMVIFPDGEIGGYIRNMNRNSVVEMNGNDVVILTVVNGKILLLKHFRHNDRAWHYEVPRGFGEKGISVEDNARKELKEETNIDADKMIVIGGLLPDGSYNDVIYFLTSVQKEDILIETNEGIANYILATPEDFGLMIKNGQINDMFSVNAYAYAILSNFFK